MRKQTPAILASADAVQRSVAAVQRQTREEERSWIHITVKRVHLTAVKTPSSTRFADLHVANMDKTPAESINGCFETTIVGLGKDPYFSCTLHQPHERHPHTLSIPLGICSPMILEMPENLRAKRVTFAEISKRALTYSEANKRSYEHDKLRMPALVAEFGTRIAEDVKRGDVQKWLD